MNTILSYILSFVISTIIIVYIFNFPLLISNQPELVNEYYYQNAWYMIPFDFVIISLYFLSAYGISKLFKLKDDSDKILALILSVILISGTFYLIFSSFLNIGAEGTGLLSGATIIAAHYGISRAVYSGDIGIGYDSIIQSETQTMYPEKQARMAIFALFSDSLICTISILILLVTGLWKVQGLEPSEYVMMALKSYVPKVEYFMALKDSTLIPNFSR